MGGQCLRHNVHGGYAVTAHTSISGGTGIAASDYAPNPFSFNLDNVGDSTNFYLFRITINDDIDSSDDLQSNPITVDFSLTQPGANGGTVTGSTTGQSILHVVQGPDYYTTQLDVSWDGPIDIDFSGIILHIALQDRVIDCGRQDCTHGDNENAKIKAYFELTAVPTNEGGPGETPLPAALPMFAAGLGLVGGLGYRRRRKAKRAA